MKDDTREELERIEKELLAEDAPTQVLPDTDEVDQMIKELLAEPAFDDPDRIHDPEEPLVYCNYSNDYGRDLKKKREDKILTGLMITASVLCLGIIGILIYWLNAYL